MENPDQNRVTTCTNNRKLLFIICSYIFLIMLSGGTPENREIDLADIKSKLAQNGSVITMVDALSVMPANRVFEGVWKKQSGGLEDRLNYALTENEGSFSIQVFHDLHLYQNSHYGIEFKILDGQYIDKGTLIYDIPLQSSKYVFERISANEATTYAQISQLKFARYRKDKILVTEEQTAINITDFRFVFTSKDKELEMRLILSTQTLNLQFSILKPESKNLQTILFSIVVLICSALPFRAALAILKSVYEQQDNTRKYSLITVILTNMWDATLCMATFIFSFQDQESLLLLIIPAFMLCLLFTNLQPRFLLAIYQNLAANDLNIRQFLCRFNIIHYGSLFFLYPIIIISNFNSLFFIALSCIVFPQIYSNGVNNIRPKVLSAYYSQYLFSRFLIIFYLKCFPYNLFRFEPDYLLGLICFLAILTQYSLLFTQQFYGAKKIIPNFLLQPVYDYKFQEEISAEQRVELQCSICLQSLHNEPPQNPNELDIQPAFKLMKTPCNHSYHSRCLMVWMKIKMECPQCRCQLPPYE